MTYLTPEQHRQRTELAARTRLDNQVLLLLVGHLSAHVRDDKLTRVCAGIVRDLRPFLAQPVVPAEQPLTTREMQVLTLIAQGMTNLQIANRIGRCEHTVKSHVARILRKLVVPNRGAAVAKAYQLGLIASSEPRSSAE